MIPLLAVVVLVGLVIVLLWWLLIETEGVYLGRRVVIWLYDLYASRYDQIKEFNDVHDYLLLAQPILHRTHPRTDPLVLDVATGTGRLPLALVSHKQFDGHIIGIDLSSKMLEIAQQKFEEYGIESFVTLLGEAAESLPFPDASFDVVTCLEALEFMSNQRHVITEMVRVLRPGGIFLVTNRINMKRMPGKIWSENELKQFLESTGVENVEFENWQHDYQKVWGTKRGQSSFTGMEQLSFILAESGVSAG